MTQQESISPNEETRSLPLWRFAVPLLLQVGLILALPAQSVYTHITGKTVILQTIPIDPYDPLRGYSQTLSYKISRPENLQKLSGWQEMRKQQKSKNADYLDSGTELYVILESPPETAKQPPQAWKPVMVSGSRPTALPANQIALKGIGASNSVIYGLETYYFPESRQQEINQAINQARRRQQPSLVVEIKVDKQGHGVPVSIWVSDRNYRF